MAANREHAARRIHERAAEAVNFAMDATCPLYVSDGRGTPDVIGSAVAVRVRTRSILMSAAHTLDFLERNKVYVGGNPDIVHIGGQFFRTSRPDAGRNADRLDLGLYELRQEETDRLAGVNFVAPTVLYPDERPDRRPVVRSKYLILGYPRSQQPRQLKGEHHSAPSLNAVTHEVEELDSYERLGCETATHLLLHFQRDDFANAIGEIVAPHPRGVSGGGVWLLQNFMGTQPVTPRLVAIATEFHEKEGILVATRIRPLLEVMVRRYPETR